VTHLLADARLGILGSLLLLRQLSECPAFCPVIKRFEMKPQRDALIYNTLQVGTALDDCNLCLSACLCVSVSLCLFLIVDLFSDDEVFYRCVDH
jgi:hypothetical protein